MTSDPLMCAYRPTKMAGRDVGDPVGNMAQGEVALAALTKQAYRGLAGQACDNRKHIKHETPQHVNSFQTTYLLNTAVTANCCAVQQKCVSGASAQPGFPAVAARRIR